MEDLIIKGFLCTIGNNENLYISKYVAHYKKLGYNHIFIYDNNDINDERIDNEIKNSDFITIIDCRGTIIKK